MNVLVTGGAGFIGSHIVDQLVAAGHRVRVVDSLSPAAHRARPDYLNPQAQYVVADLADTTMLEASTNRPPNRRACRAASRLAVAASLSATYAATSAKSTPRPTREAWWQTASTPATAAAATAVSARSATTYCACGLR